MRYEQYNTKWGTVDGNRLKTSWEDSVNNARLVAFSLASTYAALRNITVSTQARQLSNLFTLLLFIAMGRHQSTYGFCANQQIHTHTHTLQ